MLAERRDLLGEESPFPLEEIYEKRISKLDARDLWAGKMRVPHDRYQWPLVLALAVSPMASARTR